MNEEKKEKQQSKQQKQQHRAIWGRLAIAESPYPVIAADDVVISLYANRILFRLASSTFTVTVFIKDIIRITFYAEENSLEMQVTRVDGGYRAYIVTCQEPSAAFKLHDVLLPLLPTNVKDSSLGGSVRPLMYSTDYPFALLSKNIMSATGFYELFPRKESLPNGKLSQERSISTRLFFPEEKGFMLPFRQPLTSSINPSITQQEQQKTEEKVREEQKEMKNEINSNSWQQFQHHLSSSEEPSQICKLDDEVTPPSISRGFSRPVESLQRGSESVETIISKPQEIQSDMGTVAQDEPVLVTYNVISGELTYVSGDRGGGGGGGGGEEIIKENEAPSITIPTPPSYSKSPYSSLSVPGVQSQFSQLTPRYREASQNNNNNNNNNISPIYSSSMANKSPSLERLNMMPGAFRIGVGISNPASRSVSNYSQWSGVGTSSVPVPLPRRSSSALSFNGHVYNLEVE